MSTDDQLDTTSRNLLNEIDELKGLELQKRQSARSTDEFHELADVVETKARNVFNRAQTQRAAGEEDSPIQAERDEQHPGDWTEGSRN